MKIKNNFKVIVIILLFSMLSICLFACKNTTEETKNNTGVEENVNGNLTGTKEPNELYFTYEFESKAQFYHVKDRIIKNNGEFKDYLENEVYSTAGEEKKSKFVEEKLAKYDENFFDNNILIIARTMHENSWRYSIKNLFYVDNKVYFVVEEYKSKEPQIAINLNRNFFYYVKIDKSELNNVNIEEMEVAGFYKLEEYEKIINEKQ